MTERRVVEVKQNGYIFISVSRTLAGQRYRVFYGLGRKVIVLVSEDVEHIAKKPILKALKKIHNKIIELARENEWEKI